MAVTFKPQGVCTHVTHTPETRAIHVSALISSSFVCFRVVDTATILDFRARLLDIIEGPVERGPRWVLSCRLERFSPYAPRLCMYVRHVADQSVKLEGAFSPAFGRLRMCWSTSRVYTGSLNASQRWAQSIHLNILGCKSESGARTHVTPGLSKYCLQAWYPQRRKQRHGPSLR